MPGHVAQALRADDRRIVIVGASGWIGRTTLALLRDTLGAAGFAERVVCFGSADRIVDPNEDFAIVQHALNELCQLAPRPTLLFHLAFLTKDKISGMDAGEYARANRSLSAAVRNALDRIGVDRLFVASSGAAAFAADPDAAADLRLYGALKLEDEAQFAAWARDRSTRCRVAIARIYSVSGPWMNKHETYALASFILDGIAGRPIAVRAPRRVLRSYVAARELVALVVAMLLAADGAAVQSFSTGGEALELGDVAGAVARVTGSAVQRAAISQPDANDYTGDTAAWDALLARHGMAHLPLDAQIAETAAWLARQAGESSIVQAG